MNKKKMITLILIILLVVGLIIALVIIGDAKNKKQEEKNKISEENDKAALKLINNACDNYLDENGDYNLGGKETEVVCEKGFCHITYQGENYGFSCDEK